MTDRPPTPTPPDPPSFTRDQQAHRAIANALWKPLRAALTNTMGGGDWPHGTAYAVNDPTGNPRSGMHSTASGVPGPVPRVEPLDEGRLHAVVHPEDWPRGVKLAARLTKTGYEHALEEQEADTYWEWWRALWQATARHPFTQDTNRHGTPVLRRNPKDPLITPRVAAFLEHLAAVAFVEVVTPELEDALIDDLGINAAEMLAVAQKAGVDCEEDEVRESQEV